ENQRCRSSRQQGNKPPPLIPPEKKGRSRNPAPSFEKGQGGHPLVFRGRGAPVAVCASLRRSDLPAPRLGRSTGPDRRRCFIRWIRTPAGPAEPPEPVSPSSFSPCHLPLDRLFFGDKPAMQPLGIHPIS